MCQANPSMNDRVEDARDRNLHHVTVQFPLDGTAWNELRRESERVDIAVSELVSFAVLYYLADVDSNRISRRATLSPARGEAP